MEKCTMPEPGTTRALMTGIGQTNSAARMTGAARTMRVCENVCETARAVAPVEIKAACADHAALSSMGMISSPATRPVYQKRSLTR